MVMRIKIYREKQKQTKTTRYQCYLINPLRVEILERKNKPTNVFYTFLLLMYLYGEGLVSCKNLFPMQLYMSIDNKIDILPIFTY
jgi:hypothetical protein